MSSKRLLTLFCALFLSLGLLAVPASALTTFTGGASQGTFASKPAAPTVTISNVASSGKIRLTWNAVSGASSYQIYRSTSKNGTYKLVKTATGTSFTNTSAVAGKTYYYYVVAVAKDGTKSAKSTVKSRTCDLAQPVISTSNVASSGKVKVSWDAVENATGYTICIYDADGALLKTATTTKTSATHSTGVAGVNYSYKVRATCAVDSAASAYSAAKSRTCDLARPEVTISNVASSGKVKVSWDKVKGATKYAIYIYDEDGALLKTSTTTKTSATHNSGVAGEVYTYKVRAQCAVSAATSAYSSAVSRLCWLPQPVASVAFDEEGRIVVSWDPVPGASAYYVYSFYSDGELHECRATSGTKVTYYDLGLYGRYCFMVEAGHSNYWANSIPSEEVWSDYYLKFSRSYHDMYVGETYKPSYEYAGSRPLTWRSRDESIATVDANGVITAHSKGVTDIEVTDGIYTELLQLIVTEKGALADSIDLLTTDGPFYDGVTRYAGDNVWAVFRTDFNAANRKIYATSSDPSVVSVSTSSNTGGKNNANAFIFSFNSAGTATITVKSADGAVIHRYKMTIKSDYPCSHGKTHTPEEWADCATNVACANGMKKNTTLGSWRLFTLTDEQLTRERAILTGQGFVHDYWINGVRYCYIEYMGLAENGKHLFYKHWG